MRKNYPIDQIISPIQRFIRNQRSGGIVLALSVILALILANSPYAAHYFSFFQEKIGLAINSDIYFSHSIQAWINEGLMAMFFFVVGLELKREIISGELSSPRKAILPIVAAIGGMVFPALIYIMLNPTGEASNGWGIPMATDLAFALGILYLLGDRIPITLKIFLVAFAIVDDLGAVLVIAFFYTSKISFVSLGIGLGFVLLMFIANKVGVRSLIFYALVGILGVWMAFLLSGVHATIAAVLAAFTIPANVILKEDLFNSKMSKYMTRFRKIDPNNNVPTLTPEQVHVVYHIKHTTNRAIPPLQRLEHSLHPFVTFVVLPLFALANAGVSFAGISMDTLFESNVAIGVGLGLVVGKVLGIFGVSMLLIKLRIADFPKGVNSRNLLGVGILSGIGFTMSLFITSLAFDSEIYITQAKIGVFVASLISGIAGYLFLRKNGAPSSTKDKALRAPNE